MSTRSKYNRTRFFLAELEYCIKNDMYARHTGGVRMLQISDILVDETYATKPMKEKAATLWQSIDKILNQYTGPFAEEIMNNLTNTNSRI